MRCAPHHDGLLNQQLSVGSKRSLVPLAQRWHNATDCSGQLETHRAHHDALFPPADVLVAGGMDGCDS